MLCWVAHMPTSAVMDTSANDPFIENKIILGMRRADGIGFKSFGTSSLQTAAQKQNVLNKISMVLVNMTIQAGIIWINSAFAPTPLASAANPVRTQAA